MEEKIRMDVKEELKYVCGGLSSLKSSDIVVTDRERTLGQDTTLEG